MCFIVLLPHKTTGAHGTVWGQGWGQEWGQRCITSAVLTGQGLNQGMEDAVELAYFLSQGGLLPDNLRKFEASRIPRVQEVMACEMVRSARKLLQSFDACAYCVFMKGWKNGMSCYCPLIQLIQLNLRPSWHGVHVL